MNITMQKDEELHEVDIHCRFKICKFYDAASIAVLILLLIDLFFLYT